MKVVVIDCGGANLASVSDALLRLGVDAVISNQRDDILTADKVILPGVGHARVAMDTLVRDDLIADIAGLTQPVLGICVGLQQLGGYCQEGDAQGMSLISAQPSLRIPASTSTSHSTPTSASEVTPPQHKRKVPHMGWNTINCDPQYNDAITKDLPAQSYFYFVHSYYTPPLPAQEHNTSYDLIATTTYDDLNMTAIVKRNNYYGVQFHPERSGENGHILLRNFIQL